MRKGFSQTFNSPIHYVGEEDLNVKRQKLSTQKVMRDNRTISVSVYVVDDPSTRYQGLKSYDFALENLIEAGVEIKPVTASLSKLEIDDSIPKD